MLARQESGNLWERVPFGYVASFASRNVGLWGSQFLGVCFCKRERFAFVGNSLRLLGNSLLVVVDVWVYRRDRIQNMATHKEPLGFPVAC